MLHFQLQFLCRCILADSKQCALLFPIVKQNEILKHLNRNFVCVCVCVCVCQSCEYVAALTILYRSANSDAYIRKKIQVKDKVTCVCCNF